MSVNPFPAETGTGKAGPDFNVYRNLTQQAAGLLQIRRILFAVLALSMLTNALLAGWALLRRDETRTVILTAAHDTEYVAMRDTVSPNLMERFALSALSLVVNVTPATAEYQTERFLRHVAPESYGTIAAILRRGAAELARNQAAVSFFVQAVSVDDKQKRVCVQGEEKTLIGKAVTGTRSVTVCTDLLVRDGRLWIASIRRGASEEKNNSVSQ